ncbi:MAG: hypothetical protein VX951_01870 [Planctomycetota bacterium]|nr:hypothetical protein [Planctomycetota bacterium]
MRIFLLALIISCTHGVLPGQRYGWNLDQYSAAHYQRQATVKTEILERIEASVAAPAKPKANAKAKPTAKPKAPKVGNLLLNPSAEHLNRNNPHRWGKLQFAGSGKLVIDRKQAHAGKVSLVIHSTPDQKGRKRGFDAAWVQGIKVEKNSRYRLSGWIKTEAIDQGSGAQIGIQELGKTALSKPVLGTSDWTEVRVDFHTRDLTAVRASCALGAFDATRGKAWFDKLSVLKLGKAAAKASPFARKLFPRQRPAATLHGRHLDPKKQYLTKRSSDPRDLSRSLGLDLRRTSHMVKLKRQILELPRGFERIWVETTYDSVQTNGTQKITTRFGAMKPRRIKMPKPKRARNGKLIPVKNPPFASEALIRIEGQLTIDRLLNPERQRVENFTSKLVMGVEMPKVGGLLPNSKVRVCRLTFDEKWSWVRNSTPNDSHFQARVNNAIHSGARNLRSVLSNKLPNAGKLALAILTLIKAGVDPQDALVQKAVNRLRKAKLTRTYDLATAIMALEAVYAPVGERDALIEGRILKPTPRKPTPADKKILEEWVKTLLGNCDQRVQSAYSRRWNYTPAKRFDNSNTQYALLGLYTAMLCGVEVSPTVWFAAANHWLDVQCRPESKPVLLKLVSHQELEAYEREHRKAVGSGKERKRKTVKSGVPTKARGWSYVGKGGKPTGSMTAAGITGLVICDSALRQAEKGTRKLRNRIRDAVDCGFAWLARHFSVEHNPNAGNHWHYYYLYGLERACELNGTAVFQDRRWYSEGAEQLLADQHLDGKWGNLENTCFAILFLKKAAPPVITGR